MSVYLLDLRDSLSREISPPGEDLLSGMSDSQVSGYLSDAFWEARLDGFLAAWTCDEYGDVTPVTGTEDLDRSSQALIVLYAGVRMLRNMVLNEKTGYRAKAGSVEYEYSTSATMLVEILKQLKASKDRILKAGSYENISSTVDTFDRVTLMQGRLDGSG